MPMPKQTISDRFWSKVNKTDGCWLWLRNTDAGGYGVFKSVIKSVKAHRFAYELAKGAFDPSWLVLHKCDNPPCVNPDHLFLGTHADNTRDKIAKNRHHHSEGTKNPAAKLNAEQILEIRAKYAAKEYSQVAMATQYGVSQNQISLIVRRKNWKHI
ncbi:MAG: HNH endonuclease [Acidobacteria bacterium]|nr:HNH endonuclease [Acidobacteriota bacterium]